MRNILMVATVGALLCCPEDLRAQNDDGASAAPMRENCPPTGFAELVTREGHEFRDVTLIRHGSPVLDTHDFFVQGTPISVDRRFVWVDGGARLECWQMRVEFPSVKRRPASSPNVLFLGLP